MTCPMACAFRTGPGTAYSAEPSDGPRALRLLPRRAAREVHLLADRVSTDLVEAARLGMRPQAICISDGIKVGIKRISA